MGTRGVIGFVVDGEAKITYNHWDSYPDGIGLDVLNWLRSLDTEVQLAEAADQARALFAVDEDAKPTAEELKRYARYHDKHVSAGDDWYALLRETQGKPAEILRAGAYSDAKDFPRDSLFCEWGWIVDFDAGTFEAYKGFQNECPTKGRWADMEPAEKDYRASDGSKYWPIQRLAVWSLSALPSDEEFFAPLREDEEEDDL
jgi:hypothetical protein